MKPNPKHYLVLGAVLLAYAGVVLYFTYFSRVIDSDFESRWNYGHGGDFYVTTPSMSPDGDNIIYDSYDAGFRVNRVSRDGRNVVVLYQTPKIVRHPIYSPDGQTIAFAKETDGYEHLWTMDSNGSNHVPITFK